MDEAIRDRFVLRFGPEVVAWCDALPDLVREFAARWGLDPVDTHGGGTSRVFRCVRRDAGVPVWLKLTPEPTIAREEAEALRRWAGAPSVVDLPAEDMAAGVLLLADVSPGRPVKQLAWQLPEVAAVLRDLRAATPAGSEERTVLRPLADRVAFIFDLAERRPAAAEPADRFDPALLDRGRAASLALATGGPVRLVHGDLHPANVLSGPGARMVAIDPRPSWGDPDFDTVDWVLDGVADLATLERRIGTLASMVPGMSPERVLGWCRAQAALFAAPRVRAGREDARTRFLLALAGQAD